MIVSAELDVVVETLLLLSLTGKVVGLGPAGAKKDKGHDKNNSDLFHILSLSAYEYRTLSPSIRVIRISLTFAGLIDQNSR